MPTHKIRKLIKRFLMILTCALLATACVLPLPGETPQLPTGMPGISDAMLTAAAATIVSQLTAQAPGIVVPPQEATPVAPEQALAPTAAEQVAPTSTPLASPPQAPTATIVPQAVVETSSVVPIVPITALPVNLAVVEYGSQFVIENINIFACGSGPFAIFKILNQSEKKLESLSLHIQDLSTGAVLIGPWVSDAPFIDSDKSCSPGGIDVLAAGTRLYVGNNLGSYKLNGHTIRTTLLLCSKESLAGNCTQKVIDFIYP